MGAFIDPLLVALQQLTSPTLLVLVVIGVVYGVIAGALPGLGTTLAYGLVLPFTFAMDTVNAVAFLLAITVAIGYGNSLPAILVGVPGTPAAVLTCLDGYALHKRGESSLALGVNYVSALVGQLVSILFFVVMVIPLARLAYSFLAPELFSLYLFGVVAIVSLTGKNVLKGIAAAGFGFAIALVGIDPVNFTRRFDFGVFELRQGFSVPAVIIGLLAVSELLRQTRQSFQWDSTRTDVEFRFPPFSRIRRAVPALLGGTVVGTLIGAIPGAGATPAAMIAYQQAQAFSKHPEEFGRGSIEGIAANEASQNASNSGELIPTLGLGIPGSGSMTLLLAALSINGFIPGPNLIREAPQLLSATIAGMLGATVLLLITGWWMAKLLLRLLSVNRSVVIVLALATVTLGVYSINYRLLDVYVAFAAGAVGYFMLRYGYSTAAAALAVVLASGFEAQLRRGLNLFGNDPAQFFGRPITAAIVVLAAGFFFVGARRTLAQARRERLAAPHETEAVTEGPAGSR
ncbi:MAG: hypothetical protein RLZZ272_603 [Actinomycetota bacterium]